VEETVSNNAIADYEAKQAAALRSSASALVLHRRVRDYKDLYPDVQISSNDVSYCRGLNPLPFLLLMYEKVALFIPALPQAELEQRYQLSLPSIYELCDFGLIQPVISVPQDYDTPHLSDLLSIGAPSVWARGLQAVSVLGMQEVLDERACPLPISEMARSPSILTKFNRRYPQHDASSVHEIVKHDLLVNYADLAIFGHRSLADSLVSYKEPRQIASMLYLLSETLTYPHLFGFNGTANYDALSIQQDPEFIQKDTLELHSVEVPFNKRELDIFLRGIGLKLSTLDTKQIVAFHKSGDGARLRTAVKHFEQEAKKITSNEQADLSNVFGAEENLKTMLLEAARTVSSLDFVRRAERADNTVDYLFRGGTIAVGAFAGHPWGQSVVGGLAGLLGGGAIMSQLLLPAVKERLLDGARKLYLKPGLANLWSVKTKQK
jgi:hypothetical protein